MTGSARLSRLNPAYLAARNGGALFLCAALGIAGGLVYQALAEPRGRVAHGSRILSAVPPDTGANHDWEATARRIAAFLEAPAHRGLFTANLRHVVKRSLGGVASGDADPAALRNRLLAYREPASMDTSPWDRPFPPYFGPEVQIARSEMAANMDFQSLAEILADADPPPGGEGWDFSFFVPLADVPAASDMVAEIEPENRFFRVFHRIHELREGGPAASAAEAWQSAVAELDERLARESEFQGGGGFGGRAEAALFLELDAVPILAANGLYGVVGEYFGGQNRGSRERDLWEERWSALRSRVDRTDPAHARLALEMPGSLSPLFFPADSPLTRINAFAVETAFLLLDARMARSMARAAEPRGETLSEPEKPAAPPPPEQPKPSLPDAPPDPVPPEAPDHPALDRFDARIEELEREALAARTSRDACLLRHRVSRADAEAALAETFRARERADRFKERLDALEMDETTVNREYLEHPRVLELRESVEDVKRRLAGLLLTCTEEHPFVRAARRELAAAERRLLEADDGAVAAALEERRIRVKNLRLEWRMADEAAVALAARRDHAVAAADCLLGELSVAEERFAAAEHAVREAERSSPLRIDMLDRMAANMGRIADNILKTPIPAPPLPPEEKAAPPPPAPPAASRPVFTPGLSGIAVAAMPLSPLPLKIGAAAGLCLGILWILVHELFGARLTNAFEARRWVNATVIASIPRYDAKSLAQGARAMGGKLEPCGGRRTFIPPPADAPEAVPPGNRRALAFRGTTRRWFGFAAGAVVLLLAAGVRQAMIGDAWRRPPDGHALVFREERR